MKKTVFIILSVFIFFSCSRDNTAPRGCEGFTGITETSDAGAVLYTDSDDWNSDGIILDALVYPNPYSLSGGDLNIQVNLSSSTNRIIIEFYRSTCELSLTVEYNVLFSAGINSFVVPQSEMNTLDPGYIYRMHIKTTGSDVYGDVDVGM